MTSAMRRTYALSIALCGAALAAAPSAWTDRNEYDLALTIRAEAAPKKRLALLEEWKAKYPKTELRQTRRELFLSTYQALDNSAGMLAVAKEMLGDDPRNFVGLYWSVILIPAGKDAAKETLDLAETSARGLLDAQANYFSAAHRPESLTPQEWQGQKNNAVLLAHRALGWAAWQRSSYAPAREEFAKCLEQSPNDAEISAWMGIMMALQKQPDQTPTALWHLARAASLGGEGALPQARQREVNGLFERLYASYHGGADGLNELRARAITAPLPPPDFTIESAAVVAERKRMEELERTDPELAAWLRIRKQLAAPGGDLYFAQTLRPNPLPKLKGTVVRTLPVRHPKTIVLALIDATTEEVVLQLDAPLTGDAPPGTQLEFEGAADSFSANPFSLTVTVSRDKIEGWQGTANRMRPPQ